MMKAAGSPKYALHCTKCKDVLEWGHNVARIAGSQRQEKVVGYLLKRVEDFGCTSYVDSLSKKASNNPADFDLGCIYYHLRCKKCNAIVGRSYTVVPEDLLILKQRRVLLSGYVAVLQTNEAPDAKEQLIREIENERKEYEKQKTIYQKLADMNRELGALQCAKEQKSLKEIVGSVETLLKSARCMQAKLKANNTT